MLPSKSRVGVGLFNTIMRKGRTINGSALYIRFIKGQGPNFSVVAPKKTAGKRMVKNKAKKRVYAALRELKDGLPHDIQGLFFIKDVEKETTSYKSEITAFLSKIHMDSNSA